MALTKFNFNSFDVTTVASTGLAFNSSANGFDTAAAGAMTLIATNTISSGVSSSSFTSGIDSTYDTYLFKFINIHPASDSYQLTFQGSTDGGSNYNTTITSTFFNAKHDEGDTTTGVEYVAGFDLAQGTGYQPLSHFIGNDNDQSTSGELFLFSPSNTTFVKHFIARLNTYYYTNYSMDSSVAGYFNTTSAINAIDFKISSGNIDSGVIKMYGITK
jgi:hypothetical protein